MAASEIIRKTYAPQYLSGKLYASVYGSTAPMLPLGNCLELMTEQKEDVVTQDDMTMLGGGKHAEIRRVTDVNFKAKLADLNVINLARAVLGTITPQDAGVVTDKPYVAQLGGLIPLPHINLSNVVLKKGSTVVVSDGNYDVLPEGIWVRADATDLSNSDAITLSYSYADQVVIEALTAKASELVLRFAGLNEADSGKPFVVDMWRVSQGVTKQLTLLKKGFGALEVEGGLLQDSTKVGVGISRYMRAIQV